MRDEKARILDEFVVVNRVSEALIHLLKAVTASVKSAVRSSRLRRCDDAVRESALVLWDASDRVCGKEVEAARNPCWSKHMSATSL